MGYERIATIKYPDFLRIFPVPNPASFSGFKVEHDGIYVILQGNHVILTNEERAVLSWHPTGYYDQPALPLPCKVEDLRAFIKDAGLSGPGAIDEKALAEILASQLPTESATQRRARLFDCWVIEDIRNKRGAVARVFEREKEQNPKADRSNVGADIRKGRSEREKAAATGGNWWGQLAKDGKRGG